MKLHHLALGAIDVDALAQFYEQSFDLERVREHQYDDGAIRSIWLALEPGVLMIEHVQAADARVENMSRGLFLIAFSVGDNERAEREEAVQKLGATLEERGANTTYFRDPEGNRIAISRYPMK